MLEERKLVINLLCPSFSLTKLFQLVAWEDERIDLASVSTKFGLDPLTIKINGHFISRGVDFVASSVTWKSLISFFSARGRSTGVSASDPLIVDGKLCRVGIKRAYDPTCTENVVNCTSEWGNKKPLDEDYTFFKKSSFKGSGYISEEDKITGCEGIGLKRKHQLDVVSPCKKMQMYESNPPSYVSSNNAVEEYEITKSGESTGRKRKTLLDAYSPLKKTQICETNMQSCNSAKYAENCFKCDVNGKKRKQQVDVVWPEKKMRMHETNLGMFVNGPY